MKIIRNWLFFPTKNTVYLIYHLFFEKFFKVTFGYVKPKVESENDKAYFRQNQPVHNILYTELLHFPPFHSQIFTLLC